MKLACGHKCSVFFVKTAFLIKIFLSMGQKSDQTLKNVNADRSSFFCQKNRVFINGVWPLSILSMARKTSRSSGMPPQIRGLPFEIHWHAKVHHGTERCMCMDFATYEFLRHFSKSISLSLTSLISSLVTCTLIRLATCSLTVYLNTNVELISKYPETGSFSSISQ